VFLFRSLFQKKFHNTLESSAGVLGRGEARGSASPRGELEAVDKGTVDFVLEKTNFLPWKTSIEKGEAVDVWK